LITMPTYHPHPDDQGKPVLLRQPHGATPLAAWSDPDRAATVIPGGDLPEALNGIAFQTWRDAPTTDDGWNSVAGQLALDEPPLKVAPGKAPAAGVVIEEADGRIWLVAPSNAFGGYSATFPKGRVDGGVNLQACAIREAFEESGLRVAITGWLADANRTLTCTRYYRAVRTGGTPAHMGWESQAVHLVPRSALKAFVAHPNDLPLLKALLLPIG
jgi:8-oxo-dGTP pyrophosphatase MutT (NUDIX family)